MANRIWCVQEPGFGWASGNREALNIQQAIRIKYVFTAGFTGILKGLGGFVRHDGNG